MRRDQKEIDILYILFHTLSPRTHNFDIFFFASFVCFWDVVKLREEEMDFKLVISLLFLPN